MELKTWVCNPHYTPMAQLLVSFSTGVLLSPWGSGLFFLLVSIIACEILVYFFSHSDASYWDNPTRSGVILATVFGWLVGRQVVGADVLKEGVPSFLLPRQ